MHTSVARTRASPAPGPHVPLWVDIPEGTVPANAYMSTFSIGHAAFHVFGNETGRAHQHNVERSFGRTFARIWPVPGAPVIWPPELVLSRADLDAITNLYL